MRLSRSSPRFLSAVGSIRNSELLLMQLRRASTTTAGKAAAPIMSSSIRRAAMDDGFGGFDGNMFGAEGGGSVNGIINTKRRQQKEAEAAGVLPCDVPGSDAAAQSDDAAQQEIMAQIAATGKLPSPKRDSPPPPPPSTGGTPAAPGATTAAAPTPIQRSSLPKPLAPGQKSSLPPPKRQPLGSKPPLASPKPSAPTAADAQQSQPLPQYTGANDAAQYYKDLPRQELTKEELWGKIQQRTVENAEQQQTALETTEAEYLKMEEELKEHDLFHYRVGEAAFPDETMRRDYWAMWQLLVSLNQARWSMLEIHNQRGVKTTGGNMKMLFWKESIYQIAEKRDVTSGQFVDSHPILRPFASAIKRHPKITKTFVRGFADARLKVMQQPANIKQLFDHFDKFYGHFYNVMLEILDIKDDNAEHTMCHIGRAIGLTQHCVMFWKKYAKLGFTMLPADMCADHQVNLTLLKNTTLASRDRAVRHLLCSVMAIAKEEMMHAHATVKLCPPKIWPLLTEAFYPNYYLGFLQKHEFNVSAMFADHNIENVGFAWYRLKKRWEWEKHHDLERLAAEAAPLPFIGTSWGHRGSAYRKADVPKDDPSKAAGTPASGAGPEAAQGSRTGSSSCGHSHGEGSHGHHH